MDDCGECKGTYLVAVGGGEEECAGDCFICPADVWLPCRNDDDLQRECRSYLTLPSLAGEAEPWKSEGATPEETKMANHAYSTGQSRRCPPRYLTYLTSLPYLTLVRRRGSRLQPIRRKSTLPGFFSIFQAVAFSWMLLEGLGLCNTNIRHSDLGSGICCYVCLLAARCANRRGIFIGACSTQGSYLSLIIVMFTP